MPGRDVIGEAIDWLQKGATIVERMEIRDQDAPGLIDLKVRHI